MANFSKQDGDIYTPWMAHASLVAALLFGSALLTGIQGDPTPQVSGTDSIAALRQATSVEQASRQDRYCVERYRGGNVGTSVKPTVGGVCPAATGRSNKR